MNNYYHNSLEELPSYERNRERNAKIKGKKASNKASASVSVSKVSFSKRKNGKKIKPQSQIERIRENSPTGLSEILEEGIVVFSSRGICRVKTKNKVLECRLSAALSAKGENPVAGDEVFIRSVDEFNFVVNEILPRRSYISRIDPGNPHKDLVITANVDAAVIALSVKEPPFKLKFIDRCLVTLQRGGVNPIICVNKWDLLTPREEEEYERILNIYRELKVPVIICSALKNTGIDQLKKALLGKTCVFIGHSGVGKSSLLNSLAPEFSLKTNTLRQSDKKGRHTTTSSIMYEIKDDIKIIDTPGLRELGIRKLEKQEICNYFQDFTKFAEECRFRGCTHTQEPHCAVRRAVKENKISLSRYQSYIRLLNTQVSFEDLNNKGNDAQSSSQKGLSPFICSRCGETVTGDPWGTTQRNHCPRCLYSRHLDNNPGDRAAVCGGEMEPVSLWVRKNGEWALIHRCRECGKFSSNRLAGDDNEMLLMSLAVRPLSKPPFSLEKLNCE